MTHESALKVLYLTPPAKGAAALAAQSFVAEEIQAIRDWNVQPYVLTDEIQERTRINAIDVFGLPRGAVFALPALAVMAVRHAGVLTSVMQASASRRHVLHSLP